MRMSCNGCRVLRKGCSETCMIRPCLQWIKDPESQANATLFLAKFYGRAGFMNLITNGPDHLRPAIFRSLLYEACGRIVNPTYGSVGLLWSGSWEMCQAAVEAVLKGSPIVPIATSGDAASTPVPPLKAYDIRHVSKSSPEQLHRVGVKSTRTRFKRPGATRAEPVPAGSHSRESSGSGENEGSVFSVEAASHVSQGEPEQHEEDGGLIELDLTLGLEPARVRSPARRETAVPRGWEEDDSVRMDIGLKLGA